jgi:clan AA aspartic protease (TIGR02281 family)
MKREGGVSIVPCKVNGLNLKFIFDTGASDVSISMTEATFMLKNDYLSKDDIVGKANYLDANGNISAGVRIILREIEIGGLRLTNVKASVVNNMKAPLLLGQSAISKLGAVQLDLNSNTLTILNTKENATRPIVEPQEISSGTTASIEIEPDKYEQLYNEANDYFEQANYQQAITSIDLLLADKPNHKDALLLRAISHDMLGDYKLAVADYSRVITIDPKHAIAYCYRGKSKHDLKDYTGALADLNKGLLLDDEYVDGYRWRAQTKQRLKNPASALLDYNKAIVLSPQDSSLFLDRAFLKLDMNDNTGAVIDCNKVLSMNDEYATAYYCRGKAKRNLRQYTAALSDLNKAIDLDPELGSAYTARASIKEDVYENLDGALEDYTKALELEPDDFYASIRKSMLEDKIKKNVWISVGSSVNGDKWYIYNSVVSKDYSTIKLWVKAEMKSIPTKKNGRSVTYANGHTLMLCLFNCKEREYKMLSVKSYDAKGNVIDKYENGEYDDWGAITPDSVMEIVFNKACEKYNN